MSRRHRRGYNGRRGPVRRKKPQPPKPTPQLPARERPLSARAREENRAMLETIAAVREREEARARRDHELARLYENEPMISEPTWYEH